MKIRERKKVPNSFLKEHYVVSDYKYLFFVVCLCVSPAGRIVEHFGREVLGPQCTWDGSSSVHNGLGTGLAVLVVGRDVSGTGAHVFHGGRDVGGTGAHVFHCGMGRSVPSRPLLNGTPVPLCVPCKSLQPLLPLLPLLVSLS